jgi:hypothetical protein
MSTIYIGSGLPTYRFYDAEGRDDRGLVGRDV